MDEFTKHMRWAKLKVGLVITSGLVVIFLAVMFAGNIEEMFKPRAIIYANFSDVRGLRPGAPVWFSGIEIGQVKSMYFYKGKEIRVSMSINRNTLRYLKEDSSATILTLGLLGDKYLELGPGSAEAASLGEGGSLTGASQVEFQDIIEKSKESISRLTSLAKRLDEFVSMIEKGQGTFSLFLKDRAVYDNLKDATRDLSRVLDKVDEGKGTLGKLISSETLYAELESSAKNMREFSDNLKGPDGTLYKLAKDRELYDRLLGASTSLDEFAKKMSSGKGTIGRLAEDQSLYDNLNSASARLLAILDRLDKGQGVIGGLTAEGKMNEDFKATIKEMNDLLKDVKKNPGKYFKFSLF
jgi:phospholipid/cholesterol/gamma-HCH transport system substrate-binding protein